MVSIKKSIAEWALLQEEYYRHIDASKQVEQFFKQVEDIKKYFANADFTKTYSTKKAFPPFFLPVETLNNIRKYGYLTNTKLNNVLGMVYVELRDALRSVLNDGIPLDKEKSEATKKIFKIAIPSAVNKVMSTKAQEIKKSKEYTVPDLERLFDVYHTLLKEILPQFATTILPSLNDHLVIRKITER